MKKSTGFIFVLSVIVMVFLAFPVIAEEGVELFTVDEVVVTATRYPVQLSETPVSMEVITEEEIENKNAESVAELLYDVAGVRIMSNGGPAGLKTIHIRGSVSSQVLILVDGQPVNNCQNGQSDLSQLPLYNVKRVEILKGPASAIYGANALGGVVNIITKSVSEKQQIELGLEYGSYNSSNIELNYSASEGKTGLAFAFSKKSSDGYREILDNSGLKQLAFFTKLNYNLSANNKLILTYNYNNSEKEVPGSISWPSPNATQDDLDRNIYVKWEQKKSAIETNAVIYNNSHKLSYDNPDEWGYTGASVHNTGRTGLELNRINYLNNHTLAYGLEVKNNTIDSTDNGEHEFLNKAFYIHDEWEVNSPLKLTFGARYDDHEKFASEISPRLGAVYEINKNTNLHLSAGKAYRTPTFNDLYWPADMFSEGNPDLKAETAVAYEAGIVNLKGDMKTELNIFNKDVDDMINWAAGDDFIYRPYNVNNAIIKGVEFALAKQLISNFSFNINYTYLDAKDEVTEEQLKDKHNANLGIKYSENNLELNMDARYVDGRINDMEGYTVLDAHVAKVFKIQGRNVKLALSINNLLNNEEYQINEGYPMPGRNYVMEVSTKF